MATQRPARDGARALLFERLDDGDPWSPEARPFRVHDRDGLLASVARELSRLLNTRCPVAPAELAGRERTVLEYGLADWSPAAARDPAARRALETAARTAIEAYEPRLRRVRVTARAIPGRDRELFLTVDGELATEGADEPVSFPIVLAGPDAKG